MLGALFVGMGNVIYQGLITYVFCLSSNMGEFLKGNSIFILCSCVLFWFVYQKLPFTKKYILVFVFVIL